MVVEDMAVAVQSQVVGPQALTTKKRYAGEVVFLYAYDVAYDMSRTPITSLLGQPVRALELDSDKRMPRHPFLFKPQTVTLPPVERIGPNGPIRLERTVKLLPVGAISITVRVPFAADRIEDLVVYHDLRFENASLTDEVRQLAEEIRHELAPYCIRPVSYLADEEAYTVFCVEAPLTNAEGMVISAESWLEAHRRQVASVLTQEDDIRHLSKQEAEESTGRYLSYYQNDVVVIDWDAALIVDERADFEETVYIMELANLQLAELEAYDRLLDEALERSYRDLTRRNRLRARMHVLHELREIRIDLARLSDELSNITKFFGDWHLARIYENIAARFHLADWHRTIDEKLKTLDGLYQLLKSDQMNRMMLMLEAAIVLLFIVDLILLFLGLKGP
ncbi:MAG: hypothetical protein L0Y58_08280 [Verrucomicrobia subdivision 3 bacterium]|nr:hypothetical protein [Limisphaerales bacterium]